MKIRYIGNPKDLESIKEKLHNKEATFVYKDESYILKKVNNHPDTFIGFKDNNYSIIPVRDVIYIESYSNQVLCHTIKDTYDIEDKLYEIAECYDNHGFIRISKSYIINKHHIKLITPAFNSKFTLVLSNDFKTTVTRHYLYEFKKAIGMKVK